VRGAPDNHVVNIREVRLAAGAEFVVMICGDIMTMPGLRRCPRPTGSTWSTARSSACSKITACSRNWRRRRSGSPAENHRVNIILSGDNAVVIALAARSLPARQQKQAIFWGAGAAIVLRIVLTLFAVALLSLPWLKLIGSVLLFWIGIKLLIPEDADPDIKRTST